MSYLTIETIRQEIADSSIADNIARMRLTFTNEDIAAAIKRAAKNYNSQPPEVGTVDPDRVPDTAIFIDGTVAALHRTALNRLRRNAMEAQAGNMQVPFSVTQIAQFEKIVQDYEKACFQRTHDRKMHIQINSAFGSIY